MSLQRLREATSLHDVAYVLGYRPKALAYILYKKAPAEKYTQFQIPKRSGGMRTISAPYPHLKKLQKRTSKLLQDCITEINHTRGITNTRGFTKVISHGFRRDHSIITNAACHRKKRFVFNIDLDNFFGSFNFGRVRGFFIANNNFKLKPEVATVLAQIACHENALPQGSPCSPVISNLIGHILDIHLAKIAEQNGCDYSRYADDLTFSTNERVFPRAIAKPAEEKSHAWTVGRDLEKEIERAGFTVNHAKTRMQYRMSRQEVTGLITNAKVNVRNEYWRTARAMTNCLLKTGSFKMATRERDAQGAAIIKVSEGKIDQLRGMLAFIDSIDVHNREKHVETSGLSAREKTYKSFLLYKDFFAAELPTIVCEGKTDNTHIRLAIRHLATTYPSLADIDPKGKATLKVRILPHSKVTGRLLGLTGGTAPIGAFIQSYKKETQKFKAQGLPFPVIFLVDNDKGPSNLWSILRGMNKAQVDGTAPFYYAGSNLYVVPTPLSKSGTHTAIEDHFEDAVLNTKLGGKSFSRAKTFDPASQYGKHFFAEYVVKKNANKINFSGFNPILKRFEDVLTDYAKKIGK